jgi:ferredoxin/coenzyme F420-reducing hydrogenase delta subunit
MQGPRAALRRGFDIFERVLDAAFGPDWNPLSQLGTLGWFLFWVVALTGIYLFIFFDTGVDAAYESVEWLSTDHWWHAGLARSLHRYASDLMVLVMFTHLIREFAMDRYRGARWVSWFTGIPVIWFVYMSGITGYWLVWDQMAQYVAITTTELLDSLGIFGEPIARNFLSPSMLSGRFFTLMVFLHIAIPLLLLLLMWIHTQRISEPRTRPPRGLTIITLVALIAASLISPAPLQGQADLAQVAQNIRLDWFYLGLYPAIESAPAGLIWSGALLFTVLLAGLPWMPPKSEGAAAEVFLDFCNGCARCVADCPYSAITLEPRSDGAPFRFEVAVNEARCVACGICMGSCPSSSPFRRSGDLVTGIDLPEYSLARLRADVIDAAETLSGNGRVLTLACRHGASDTPASGRVELPCVAMAPPSIIDFIISRSLADGVCIAGCAERECHYRQGIEWTKGRIERQRDPYLRARVPRDRILTVWAGPTEHTRLKTELADFAERLGALAPYENARPIGTEEKAEAREKAADRESAE